MKFFFEIVIELGSVFISQSIGDLSDGKPRGRQESGGFLHLYFVAVSLQGVAGVFFHDAGKVFPTVVQPIRQLVTPDAAVGRVDHIFCLLRYQRLLALCQIHVGHVVETLILQHGEKAAQGGKDIELIAGALLDEGLNQLLQNCRNIVLCENGKNDIVFLVSRLLR